MGKIARSLRIGEKIGFGFGLVGAIFLAVIWQYHNTLQQSLESYQTLQNIHVAKKSDMLDIESGMREARRAEKDFLLYRKEEFARQVDDQLRQALLTAVDLGKIDAESLPTAERIRTLIEVYREMFQSTAVAWRKMGLDHDSGLQGAFRDAAHELESMAGHFNVDNLYLLLLQIRRGEKDLGLRREPQYQQRVHQLLVEFENKTNASNLEQSVKNELLAESKAYREFFEDYADTALANADIQGGKGPFRQTAHRIEAILESHHIPNLASNILQLRRREKDYLLRDDSIYVDMTLAELSTIQAMIEPSVIAQAQKEKFLKLLQNYRENFIALVKQNELIDQMIAEMDLAVAEITELAATNVRQADKLMQQMATELEVRFQRREQLMLWSVAIATLLGIFFAVSITLRIVRPLRSMAGLLDKLAYEEPTERLPFHSSGRDEVNMMAGSVNTMADHKAQFIEWWKSSMREANACANLENALQNIGGGQQRTEAESELKQALAERQKLLVSNYQKLRQLNDSVIAQADSLRREVHVGQTLNAVNTINDSSRSLRSLLEMIAFQQKPGSAA